MKDVPINLPVEKLLFLGDFLIAKNEVEMTLESDQKTTRKHKGFDSF